jgi:ABC-type Na+ transport system ATPase subunit NatA
MAEDLRSDSADPIIQVRQLRRCYGGQRTLLDRSGPGNHDEASKLRQGFEAVRGVDLQVGRGELFALLGTNGAGKTSTIELVEGLAKPSGGSVRILGHDPWAEPTVVRPRTGIMLQEAGFPGALTGREMTRTWHGTLDESPGGSTKPWSMVVLQNRADVPIQSLSGGERRRLDLALALIGRPAMIFLDQPTAGFDPLSRRATLGLIRHLLDEALNTLSSAFDSAVAGSHRGFAGKAGGTRETRPQGPRRGEPRLTGTTGRWPADTCAIRLSSVIDRVSSHSARQWSPMSTQRWRRTAGTEWAGLRSCGA